MLRNVDPDDVLEVVKIIRNINDDIERRIGSDSLNDIYGELLVVITDGWIIDVKYLNIPIWDSETDGREFDENGIAKVSLDTYLRMRVNQINTIFEGGIYI